MRWAVYCRRVSKVGVMGLYLRILIGSAKLCLTNVGAEKALSKAGKSAESGLWDR